MSRLNQQTSFSVCAAVYHGDDPLWFSAAMDSVLNQTRKPSEIILVVDGPVPEELDAEIEKYEAMEPFKVIRLEKNGGHGNARRIGFANCSNELVAIMDSDDLCMPFRFEKQLQAFREKPDVSAVGGQISEFVNDPANIVDYREVPLSDEEIKLDLKKRCPLNQMTVMLKKSDTLGVGGYMDWYCNEDYYLWIRMYLAGLKFANVPEVLVNVRTGSDMYMRRGGWKYFRSELRLQNYMLKHRVIGVFTYLTNVAKRFAVQILLPNRLRAWVFKKFAREKTTMEQK